MTDTTTAVPPSPISPVRGRHDRSPVLLPAVLRAEWTKLRSVRSTIWSLVTTIAIVVGFGAIFCLAYVSRYDSLSGAERLAFDPTAESLRGLFLAQLAVGVLGVIVMSSEYATGLIRTTLTAVPQRRVVLAAKALILSVVAVIVSVVGALGAFWVGQSVLDGKHLGVSLSDPNVLRAVLGAAAYLTIIGLLGLAIATVVRRTAGAIATLFGLVLIAPLLAEALPNPWNNDVGRYLPSSIGSGLGAALFSVHPDTHPLSPATALLCLIAWLVVAYTIAAVAITVRDA